MGFVIVTLFDSYPRMNPLFTFILFSILLVNVFQTIWYKTLQIVVSWKAEVKCKELYRKIVGKLEKKNYL